MFFSIQVNSGTEYSVAKFIEATAKERGKEITRVLIPTVVTYDLKQLDKGIARKKLDILLPTYIFIEVDNENITMSPDIYNYLKSLTSNIRQVLKNSIPNNELADFIGDTYSFVELSFEEQVLNNDETNEVSSNLSKLIHNILHTITHKKIKASLSIQAFLRKKKLNITIPSKLFEVIANETSFTVLEIRKHPKRFLVEVLRIYEQALDPC